VHRTAVVERATVLHKFVTDLFRLRFRDVTHRNGTGPISRALLAAWVFHPGNRTSALLDRYRNQRCLRVGERIGDIPSRSRHTHRSRPEGWCERSRRLARGAVGFTVPSERLVRQ
jgi:hypothetical protein